MEFTELIEEIYGEGADPVLGTLMLIVGGLLIICAIASLIISIFLFFKYTKYNRKKNSIGMCGKDIARKLLDENGLEHIKVKCVGSIMFGNSYSHYFKKVRLRRLTWKKDSVTSLAMAAQKSSLAVLDKEGDPDMKRRIALVPIVTFGPLGFIPMIIIGVLLDVIIFNTSGICTTICTLLGFGFYVLSFILSVTDLKTEVKGQKRALEELERKNMATEEELEDIKELFKLYNIEYINNMIIAFLEMVYRVLQILMQIKGNSTSSSSND